MKALDTPELSHLAEILEYSSPEVKVHTRFEAYSCKSTEPERKLFKDLEVAYSLEQADELHLGMSPDMREAGLDSCFGRLDQKDSRQTWFWLISLLNVAFPDHDFSGVRPDHFVRESGVNEVLTQLSTTVLELSNQGPRSYGSYPPSFAASTSAPSSTSHSSYSRSPSNPILSLHPSSSTGPSLTHPHLRRVLDSVLQGSLSDADVYSYTPDFDSDPHAESDSDDEDALASDDGGDGSDDGGVDGDLWGAGGWEDDHHPRRGGDSDDEEDAFQPPALSSLPLVDRGSSMAHVSGASRRGCLWSVNYFFVSRRTKRILFISIWAKKRDPIFAPSSALFIRRPSASFSFGSSGSSRPNMARPPVAGMVPLLPVGRVAPAASASVGGASSKSKIGKGLEGGKRIKV